MQLKLTECQYLPLPLLVGAVALEVPGGTTSITHRGLPPTGGATDNSSRPTISSSTSSTSSSLLLLVIKLLLLALLRLLLPLLPSAALPATSRPFSDAGRNTASGGREGRLSAILRDLLLRFIHPLVDGERQIYTV